MSVSTWLDCPAVFVPIPRCAHCGHHGHIAIRSMPTESDGSKTLRVVCKRCSGRYLIVSEPADEEDSFTDLPRYGRASF